MKRLTTTLSAFALGASPSLSRSPPPPRTRARWVSPCRTESSARWIADGDNMVKVLKERGYGTDLHYAEDDIPNQLSQIENMVTKGAKVLVIASIDGTTLSDVLKQAQAQGIKVIAYDRLIRDTPNVDYYATFDNSPVGVLQAQSLLKGLGYPENKGPSTSNCSAARRTTTTPISSTTAPCRCWKPLIDNGTLKVASGQMGMDKVSTLRWDGATAQARMDNLLSADYTDKRLDGVLSPYDGLSIGILSLAQGRGLRLGRHEDAGGDRAGRGSPVHEVHPRRRAVLDHLQGHPRPRQGHRRHGRCLAERQGGHRQRHQDLQ